MILYIVNKLISAPLLSNWWPSMVVLKLWYRFQIITELVKTRFYIFYLDPVVVELPSVSSSKKWLFSRSAFCIWHFNNSYLIRPCTTFSTLCLLTQTLCETTLFNLTVNAIGMSDKTDWSLVFLVEGQDTGLRRGSRWTQPVFGSHYIHQQ